MYPCARVFELNYLSYETCETAYTLPKLTSPDEVVVLEYSEIVGLEPRCWASGCALVHHFLGY